MLERDVYMKIEEERQKCIKFLKEKGVLSLVYREVENQIENLPLLPLYMKAESLR